MPVIKLEIGELSKSVKAELIQKLTDVSSEITGIPKKNFFVSIYEMPDDNIAIGGVTVTEIKKEFGR